MSRDLDLAITIAALAVCVGIFALGSWIMSRPADPLKPRLIPWRTLILIAGVAGILALVHLVNLFGITTGRP